MRLVSRKPLLILLVVPAALLVAAASLHAQVTAPAPSEDSTRSRPRTDTLASAAAHTDSTATIRKTTPQIKFGDCLSTTIGILQRTTPQHLVSQQPIPDPLWRRD